jgi:gliding motility-associated-like protein
VFLQGSGAINYQWTDLSNPGVILSTSDTLTVQANTTTTYVLYGVTTDNCDDYDTITVLVNAAPQLTLNNLPDSVCYGDTITVIVSGAGSYIWENNLQPGVIISTNDTVNFIVVANVTLYVTGTDSNGCSSTDSILIGVKALPVALAGNDVNVCVFDTITLGATAIAGNTYLWQPATNLSSNTVANPVWVVSDTTITTYTYILTVTNNGCTQTDTVNITISPAPTLNVLPNNPAICAGDQLNLTAFGASNYIWYELNNPAVILSNTATLTTNPTSSVTYVVQGSNVIGCSNYDTINVNISPAPVVSGSINPSLLCAGDTATIVLSGAASYQWELSTNPGVVVWSDSSLTQTFNATTTYIIVAQSDEGCIDTSSITITVNPLPQTFAGNDINICTGDTIQLGGAAQAGVVYAWSPASGLSSTSVADPTVIIPDTNQTVVFTYVLTTQLNGCASTDTVNITTNLTPFVQINGNDSICANSSYTLQATGAITYAWYDASNPGVVIGNADTLSLAANQSGTFIVTGTTSPNCSSTDTITITINPLPTVTASAATDSICKGDTITLQAIGGINYTWVDASAPGIVLGTNSSLSLFLNATTTFIVTGDNTFGCTHNDTVTINTIDPPLPPTIIGDTIICDTTLQMYVVNNSATGLTYNWTVANGTIISGQGNDTLFVQWAQTGPFDITCIASNALGCDAAPTGITASIGSQTQLPQPLGNILVCTNDTLPYNAISNPNFIYNWQVIGGSIISGNGTANVIINWTAQAPGSGQVWYTITTINPDTICNTASDTLIVNFNNQPGSVTINAPSNVCLLDTVTIDANSVAGNTFTWAITNGNIISGNGTSQITVVYTTAGMQTISVFATTAAGCEGSIVLANINVNPLPVANAGNDTSICIGQTLMLNATGGNTYLWTPSAGLSSNTIANPIVNISNNASYIVQVGDLNGCTSFDSIQINLQAQLNASVNASQNNICAGGTTTLTASGGTGFVWLPASGLSSTNTAITNASPASTTTYSVLVSDAGFCSDTAIVTLTVNTLPIISTTNTISGCNGDSIQLLAQGASTYTWLPATGLNNNNISNPMAYINGSTTYTVTGTDASGCTATAIVDVIANTPPTAAFDTTLHEINCSGLSFMFTNLSSNASNYNWSFGNGSTSTESDPMHSFGFGNNFTVTLFAYNGNCVDSLTQNISTAALISYFDSIPNVFTPNGDGKNDCFNVSVKTNLAACTSIEIFNRWGNLMYKSDDTNACWDGKNQNNGDAAPKGTYIYLIKINQEKLSGTVQLLR